MELFVRSPDGFEVPARRSPDEYASSHHSDIGPDGPGIVDDEDDYPEERPEEEPGRDYPSDLEENGIFLYNDPEEHNSDPEEIDVETLMLY